MLRSRKPSKQGSYIKFTKRNVLGYWIEERSELLWGELSGNVPNLLILIRYLQKSRVHRLKPLVGAIHESPLLNSWRCLLLKRIGSIHY